LAKIMLLVEKVVVIKAVGILISNPTILKNIAGTHI